MVDTPGLKKEKFGGGRKKDRERREYCFQLYRKVQNLNHISRETGIAVTTLWRWAQEEKWDDKVLAFQEELQKHTQLLEDAKKSTELEQEVRELSFLKFLEKIIFDKIAGGELQPESWKDVLDTLKYIDNQRRLITGQPTQVVKTQSLSVEKVQQIESGEMDERIRRMESLTLTSKSSIPNGESDA